MKLSHRLGWLSSLVLPLVAVAAHAASLSPTSLTLLPGNKASIAVRNIQGTVTLANSNPAAVSATFTKGTIAVTANALGVATLSVTDRSGTKTARVTVSPPLGVSPASASLSVGQSATLTVSNAIGTISIGNSNSTAVGASLSGSVVTLTGRSAGTAEITVRDSRSSAKVQVTVAASAPAPAPSAGDIHPGRLLASNCFQCHGTNGSGGFDRIQGSTEVLSELRKFASGEEDPTGIMAAHAVGYTDEQLRLIADFLSKQ
jgi:cytochrome subunit of sulfide dehydrogenase